MSWNYSFNPNIPAANDNPSDDQPDIQINNSSIASAISEDHVAFNANYTGIHTAIRFLANQTPSTAYTLPYINCVSNTPYYEMQIGENSANASTNQYIKSANGSCLLFGGIVLKWGTATVNLVPSQATVNFAIAFPRNCFAVITQPINGAAANAEILLDAKSPTGFTVGRGFSNSNVTFYYVAIGN